MRRQNELADLQYQLKVIISIRLRRIRPIPGHSGTIYRKYLNTMNELINRNDIENARECISQQPSLFDGLGNVVDVGNTIVMPY